MQGVQGEHVNFVSQAQKGAGACASTQREPPSRSLQADQYSKSFFSPSQCAATADLKAHALCRIHNGLDCRFHDSAARQFNQYTVADFVFGHGGAFYYR